MSTELMLALLEELTKVSVDELLHLQFKAFK
jgi:hypothetical protein